jgi:hypothetical protein
MEYQLTHKDEKGYGEQCESRNGSKNSRHYRNKAWYPSQEEIGGNYIDNEKGKGNGQVGEKQKHHTPKEQTNDQPPFHGLFFHPNINKFAPCHPEELDGKEDAAYGYNDENGPFRNSHCPYVGYSLCDTLVHIINSKIDHDGTSKAADDKHDAIEIVLGFLIEMSVYDISSDMPLLSQKPSGRKENDP